MAIIYTIERSTMKGYKHAACTCARAFIVACVLVLIVKELRTIVTLQPTQYFISFPYNNTPDDKGIGSYFADTWGSEASKRKVKATAARSVEGHFREGERTFKEMMNNYYMDYDQYYRPMLTRAFNFRSDTRAKVRVKNLEPHCETAPRLLIQVHSAAINVNKRLAIRHSWGRNSGAQDAGAVKTIFIVGRSMVNSINLVIERESKEYRDILLNDYTDSYRTLSNKTIYGLRWASSRCLPDFLLKTDDDCYVNVPNVLAHLQHSRLPQNLYTGRIFWYRLTDRDKTSDYYTSYKTYRGVMYPPYASGGGYILSGHLIPAMLNASLHHKPVPNEDAYVGILMDAIEVLPMDNKRILPYIFCNESVWERPACDFVNPLIMHGVFNYAQIWIHYHVNVLAIVSGLCQHSMKIRKRIDIPLYCYSYEDMLVIERAKMRGFL